MKIRSKVTYANVMATLAVFLVLGGGGAIAAGQFGKNTIGTRQLKPNAVTTAKIKDGAVTGSKLVLSSLGAVPMATNAVNAKTADSATTATNATNAVNAKTADNATTATNALSLGGVPASGYTRSDCNALNGAVKGFARVNGPATAKGQLGTAGVQFPYNCSGGAVQAGEFLTGAYLVEFVGSPMLIAFATPIGELSATFASIEPWTQPGTFLVTLRNQSGELVEGSFNILTP